MFENQAVQSRIIAKHFRDKDQKRHRSHVRQAQSVVANDINNHGYYSPEAYLISK